MGFGGTHLAHSTGWMCILLTVIRFFTALTSQTIKAHFLIHLGCYFKLIWKTHKVIKKNQRKIIKDQNPLMCFLFWRA